MRSNAKTSKLSAAEIGRRLSQTDPRTAQPCISAAEMVAYARGLGLYRDLPRVDRAVLVYTTDWSRIFSELVGKPYRRYFEFDLYRTDWGDFILQNTSPGGQTACHFMEKLIVLGVRQFVALGHCGALCESLDVGDLVLHRRAIRGESASRRYRAASTYGSPSARITRTLLEECEAYDEPDAPRGFAAGLTYTTESMFREPRARVVLAASVGALTVETEAASIFALAQSKGVAVGSLSIVSNLVHGGRWTPGFYAPAMFEGKHAMTKIALRALRRASRQRGRR